MISNLKRLKTNISWSTDKNDKRISEPIKFMKEAQIYLQAIYTNSGLPSNEHQTEIKFTALRIASKQVKDLIKNPNPKKVPEINLITSKIFNSYGTKQLNI